MRSIRALIRSHLYRPHTVPNDAQAAAIPSPPDAVSRPNGASRRRRRRVSTKALVRVLRSFDPPRDAACAACPTAA
jgi:hypothetical protein